MHAVFWQIPQNNQTLAFPVDPLDMGTVIYNNPDNPCYLGQLLLISTPKVLGHLRISGNRQKKRRQMFRSDWLTFLLSP